MFLKKLLRKKDGKGHTYWALVESVRTAKGPRHRMVAYLGELETIGTARWDELAGKLNGRTFPVPQLGLFQDKDPQMEAVPERVSIDLKSVRVEGTKDFGDVWLALLLWRTLGFDALFDKLLSGGREEIQWGLPAAILAIGRLCAPSSELHTADTWYPGTSLAEMMGVSRDKIHVERLYRTLDVLHPHKQAVESHLKERFASLFRAEYDLLLYDVTSTYFEGECEKNPQAKRGYSRDKRFDCKQVCIALVVTTEGLPIAYEVFDGNRADVTTVEDIVNAVENKYGRANRIWVVDRGMVSEKNLKYIRGRQGRYIVGAVRSQLKKFEKEMTTQGWTQVEQGVEVKLCASADGLERFVLCRSAERGAKEKAIHQRFSKRIEDGLKKLSGRLLHAQKTPDRSEVERQIGKLFGRNNRASGMYSVCVEEDPERAGHLRLNWTVNQQWSQWAALTEGAYLLRSNVTDCSAEELWKMYIQLTDAEEAFRTIKSELRLRPIYHQTERRVQAHILVSFIAYAMYKVLQKWMESCGLGRGVRTILEEIGRLKCNDVILGTVEGRDIHLQCVTLPDGALRVLLARLKLEIPQRLGAPRWRKTVAK
ncbi:MAG: IS1634 family transposase [Pseudomonadota bacterium]